ncbi:MAG: glycosyltransferase family 2 protein [Planctomycetes bacterium]|nr:glycosyltransferase family 2 protein [Planctomycetota bacterium]
MSAFAVCAVIPTYDNPLTVGAAVRAVAEHVPDVFVVDDGSAAAGRSACDALAAAGLCRLVRHDGNRGKGAAVKSGLRAARELGFTHALQVDADGQHDVARIPAFVAAARERPDALVLGYPEYDDSAPRSRLVARRITTFWVAVELASRTRIRDAMIGFRVYPIEATLAVPSGDRMEFDIEVAVRMARAGVPMVNMPVRVRYPDRADGGVSHLRPLRDNLRFCVLHTRLCTEGATRWTLRKLRLGTRR